MWRSGILLITIGFVLGILVSSFLNFSVTTVCLFALVSMGVFTLSFVDWNFYKEYLYVGLAIIGFLIGVIIFQANKIEPELDDLVGKKISLTGFVRDEPDLRETSSRLNISVQNVVGIENTRELNVLVITELYPKYNYGEYLQIEGKLQKPGIIETPKGEFDWGRFLSKDNISYVMYRPKIAVLEPAAGSLITMLLKVKNSFVFSLQQVLSEPHSSLIAGLILGARQSIGQDLLEQFRRVGLIHILVLSGQNLAIVSDWIMRLLGFLPLMGRLIFGSVGLVLFTLMTGGQAATVRAAIMALVAMIARATGNVFNASIALVFAGVIMLIWNPKLLVFDTGFQLSFLATLGLIYLSPLVEEKITWVPKWRYFDFRGILATTIAAQVAVSPWILYVIGNISLVALPANILILPIVPVVMASGFISGLLAYLTPVLATPFSLITYVLIDYILMITRLFASFRFASVDIDGISVIIPIVFYSALVTYIWKRKKREG